MLSNEHIKLVKKIFKKYYNRDCLIILDETIRFNRDFIRDNPIIKFYDRYRAKKNESTSIEIKNKTLKKILN